MKPEKKDNQEVLISAGSASASRLPRRLTTLLLLGIIGMGWFLGNYELKQHQKESAKHLNAAVWLLKEMIDTMPSALPVSSLPSADRLRIQLLMGRMRNDLNCQLYLIDTNGRLMLTDGDNGPLRTTEGQQLQNLPEIKPAIERLLSGEGLASYRDNSGSHQIRALALEKGNLLIVGDIITPSWFTSSGFPIYILLVGGFILILLIRHFTRQTIHEWRRQSLAQSIMDPLTTLPNRKGFALLSKPIFREAKNSHTTLSLLLVNLDNFTRINLIYGTEAGDILLKQVAASLRELVKSPHLLCRWDGDEFIIMLKSHDAESAYEIAQTIQHHIFQHEFNFSGESVRLKLRIGIHSLGDSDDQHALLSGAIQALSLAREIGESCLLYPKGENSGNV